MRTLRVFQIHTLNKSHYQNNSDAEIPTVTATCESTFLRLLEEASPAYSIVSERQTRWTNVPGDDQVGVAAGVAMTSSNHTPTGFYLEKYVRGRRW